MPLLDGVIIGEIRENFDLIEDAGNVRGGVVGAAIKYIAMERIIAMRAEKEKGGVALLTGCYATFYDPELVAILAGEFI